MNTTITSNPKTSANTIPNDSYYKVTMKTHPVLHIVYGALAVAYAAVLVGLFIKLIG